MLRYVPCILTLVRVFFSFYHEWMLNFVRCFFCIYWGNHVVFKFSFVSVVDYTDLHILDHHCGIWSLLFVFGFGLLVFCWEFLHLYLSKMLACNFLSWWLSLSCFVLFWYQDYGGFVECLWECSFLFNLLEEFEKNWCKLFIYLVKFIYEAIWSWTFICREFFFFLLQILFHF